MRTKFKKTQIPWAFISSIALLCLILSQNSCFYLAPIEEAPPEVDEPPTINLIGGVSPEVGYVKVNLANEGRQQFIITQYDDANEGQALYHRNVIDFRPAGITSTPLTATLPNKIEPGIRNPIRYEITACSAPFKNAIDEGRTVLLYIILSDELFSDYNLSFSDKDHLRPFATTTGREPVWASWIVQFIGECPQ
ncbi:MAG: hypothetical protein WC966_02995 [Bradymonadales bacterium]|jgi:hypothetical protein